MRSYLPGILIGLAVFFVNIALEVYTDMPMLIRWAVVIGFGLLVTFALVKLAQRRQKRSTHEAADR